ncbi:helix-turn-helix domain-containing protein [Ancylobacter amanitiformis]|uniref:AraC-like DNA-binding protein n=1 Tax=Ancylobacter amanitiformis TaxID=217069 RepID=A0ABU0LNT0_9HYPH|nr:AraC family transcriptional regulator [Ancylobacter amanitiformis]MDQ0510356.1 AraC-like DNA-binding protein [Ancylobacter amanitiformis]
MIFVPLPFVVALILALLAIRLLRSEESGRHHALFLALIAAYALQSVLVGLRWGYDLRAVQPFQAALASLIAPLAYVAFRSLTEDAGEGTRPAWLWPHLVLPPLLVGLFFAWQPAPIGPWVVTLFLGYGGALLWLARRGPDGLVGSRLDGTLRSYRALLLTASALIGSAVTDMLISVDLDWTGGRNTPAMIASFNVVALLVLGAAAAAADSAAPGTEAARAPSRGAEGSTRDDAPRDAPPEDEPDEDEPDHDDRPGSGSPDEAAQDAAVIAALEALMTERRLFTDVDLDLGRLARRLALPARRLSQAINRTHGVSVSHYVNGLRVNEAQRLLAGTDLPVTRVMLDAGFLTKSNFNREFRRVAGTSPSAWRRERAGP